MLAPLQHALLCEGGLHMIVMQLYVHVEDEGALEGRASAGSQVAQVQVDLLETLVGSVLLLWMIL